jgi:hypothetical protein
MKCWEIKINSKKLVHVNHTLHIANYKPVFLDQQIISRGDSVRLAIHIDSRLNWKHHGHQKKQRIKNKMSQLYELVGKHSELDLTSKRLLYVMITKPIWNYGI